MRTAFAARVSRGAQDFEHSRGRGIMTGKIVSRIALGLVLGLALGLPTIAQEGHPMAGSWVGDFGPTKDQRTRVVVAMDWTGKDLAVTINPGPNAIKPKVVRVNPVDWSVHIEADGKDAQGRPAPYVIDGKIDDLGTYNRSIIGTWNVGATNGDFSITRQ
jgi:hypothetical protein